MLTVFDLKFFQGFVSFQFFLSLLLLALPYLQTFFKVFCFVFYSAQPIEISFYPASIYLFKISNINTRTMCEKIRSTY